MAHSHKHAQVYTQVEVFTSAIGKLQELGFSVNTEESELIYRCDCWHSSGGRGMGCGAVSLFVVGGTTGGVAAGLGQQLNPAAALLLLSHTGAQQRLLWMMMPLPSVRL